jgi:hypothetical protein
MRFSYERSLSVYRRRRILVAVAAVTVLVIAGIPGRSGAGSLPERVVGAMLLVGWVAAALALWSWDRRRPSRIAGSSESCLSLEPASSAAA